MKKQVKKESTLRNHLQISLLIIAIKLTKQQNDVTDATVPAYFTLNFLNKLIWNYFVNFEH